MSFCSSSWYQGLAAVCDCGTPWTFILTSLSVKLGQRPRIMQLALLQKKNKKKQKKKKNTRSNAIETGRGSSIGSEFAWHASGPEFDPHVRHILSWRLGHENISTAILPLPLIQEEQLSVTGERMCTKYW